MASFGMLAITSFDVSCGFWMRDVVTAVFCVVAVRELSGGFKGRELELLRRSLGVEEERFSRGVDDAPATLTDGLEALADDFW